MVRRRSTVRFRNGAPAQRVFFERSEHAAWTGSWTERLISGYRATMARTSKGHIQCLPSGSFRVKVYAGTDPVTGKERLLRETCPDEVTATAALARLLKEAQSHQAPSRDATFGLVLDKYLEVTDLAESTLVTHKSAARSAAS